MAEIKQTITLNSLPGVKRDGTMLDGDNYVDAQWCRFQRGKPKKMGGYQEVDAQFSGVVRAVTVWSRGSFYAILTGSSTGITQALVDSNGVTGTTYDRTPAGFTTLDGCWTIDTMYDDAAGSKNTIFIAHRNASLTNIDDTTDTQVYFGVANVSTAFTAITGLSVSGGIVAVPPYLIYYGSDGLVGWSDVNQPQTLTGGDAGFDRVTGAKVVKGLPLRSGSGPAALLWSLDSVIRMEYVGGNAIFRFSTVTSQSSILSQNSVIEYDGDYFWVGVDRFLVYSGGRVQELPNQMNKNWFFDNLNFEQRQKVWVTKIPRFGEIIWFFPFGSATECNTGIVFNVNEKVWYDFSLSRTAGYYSQVFNHPVWTGGSPLNEMNITLSGTSGTFAVNDNITINSLPYVINTILGSVYSIIPQGHTTLPAVSKTVDNNSQTGTGTVASSVNVSSAFIHEKGVNAVEGGTESAILSYFETADFGFPTGGPGVNQDKGLVNLTRLTRVEPDFVMSGEMQVTVIGRSHAQSKNISSQPFSFYPNSSKIDLREQRRQLRLRFTSNTLNGSFEMGRVILHTEPGDVRP